MNREAEIKASQERMEQWYEEKKAEKVRLAKLYPVNKIKSIDTSHIRKIGGIIGMYSSHTKREYIHHIIHKQDFDNPIITMDEDGVYHINENCALIKYFK